MQTIKLGFFVYKADIIPLYKETKLFSLSISNISYDRFDFFQAGLSYTGWQDP